MYLKRSATAASVPGPGDEVCQAAPVHTARAKQQQGQQEKVLQSAQQLWGPARGEHICCWAQAGRQP